MNVSLDLAELAPGIEQQIRDIAAKYNLDPQEYARQVMQEIFLLHASAWFVTQRQEAGATLERMAQAMKAHRVAPETKGQEAIALMNQWIAEDATDDPEEIALREADWQEMETNLQANRVSLPVPDVSGHD